jgi:hypothetical protein
VNVLARIISILFHPLLMATYLLAMLAWALPAALDPVPAQSHWMFILFIFLVTFVLPVSSLSVFSLMGTIQSFTMKERKERIVPFIFIAAMYVAITYVFYSKYRFGFNDNLLKLIIIVDMLVIVATVTTFFYKVSVHSISIWGLVGITLLLTKISEVNTLFYVTIGLIVLAGVIMSSRLQLAAHTYREVMWGSVLGLGTSVIGMILMF